jgi:small subunit ribosomal protein S6
MRQYETAFLISPKLDEEEMEKLIQKMAEVIKKSKGKMVNIEKWGKRRLAYPISGLEEAFYVFFHYQGETAIPIELERRFRQTETIIRYLTLRKEVQTTPRKKAKALKEEKQEAEAEKEKGKEEKGLEEEKEVPAEEDKSSEEK